jgi:hypothetical protein
VNSPAEDAAKTLLQVIALVGAIVVLSLIVHKGYADVSILAQKHSGLEFWMALARYLLGNLAGGSTPDA